MKDTLEYVIEKYGLRLDTSDLADAMKSTPAEVRNKISEGTFPIPTYKDSDAQRAPRYAAAQDVAEYLDKMRSTASVQVSQGRGGYTASKTASPRGRRSRRPLQPSVPSQTSGKLPHV